MTVPRRVILEGARGGVKGGVVWVGERKGGGDGEKTGKRRQREGDRKMDKGMKRDQNNAEMRERER